MPRALRFAAAQMGPIQRSDKREKALDRLISLLDKGGHAKGQR